MMLGMALTGAGVGAYMYLGNNKSKIKKAKNLYTQASNSNNQDSFYPFYYGLFLDFLYFIYYNITR